MVARVTIGVSRWERATANDEKLNKNDEGTYRKARFFDNASTMVIGRRI